ncbi:MAG: hypothetical protein BWX83_00980 [Candidatus Cloacimonetes bacterium ADurb.Bin117]|nr:MAG: hypothetical protein BWX83_00980 [Candidatus Cloacimonetes bacterium ADurb.Bin117]
MIFVRSEHVSQAHFVDPVLLRLQGLPERKLCRFRITGLHQIVNLGHQEEFVPIKIFPEMGQQGQAFPQLLIEWAFGVIKLFGGKIHNKGEQQGAVTPGKIRMGGNQLFRLADLGLHVLCQVQQQVLVLGFVRSLRGPGLQPLPAIIRGEAFPEVESVVQIGKVFAGLDEAGSLAGKLFRILCLIEEVLQFFDRDRRRPQGE